MSGIQTTREGLGRIANSLGAALDWLQGRSMGVFVWSTVLVVGVSVPLWGIVMHR